MPMAKFKTLVKYKGQYYEANKPFSIEDKDIAKLEAIFELTEEDNINPLTIESILNVSVSKLKDAIADVTDMSFLEKLIEQDERTSAKSIYQNRIEELKAAE